MKKAGTRVVGWSPPDFFFVGRWEESPHPTSHSSTHLADWGRGTTSISHSNTPHYPISPHIDEDALEGV